MAEMSPVERWIVNRASPLLSGRVLRPFFQHHLTLPAGAALLELGCGPGQTALLAYQLYRPARFVVTDYDPAEVALAQAAFHKASTGLPDGVTLETADAARLRYADASFDAVFAFFVLHHLGDRLLEGLAEIDRVLTPEGQLVYAELSRRDLIKDFLAGHGYTLVHQQTMFTRIDQVISRKGVRANAVPA